MTVLLFTACEKVDIANDEDNTDIQISSGKGYKVTVKTLTAVDAADVVYPITIKAADSNGKVVAQQTINSEEEQISLKLPNGKYAISATSGSTDYSSGYSSKPLLIGHSDVTINSGATNVTIVMSYAVAALTMTMKDVPAEVTEMKVTVSPLFDKVTEDGSYSGSQTATIPCNKTTGGQWTTGRVYLLPGTSANTVLSVAVTMPSGTEIYSITYPTPLKAAVPYTFSGTYSGKAPSDFTITGSLQYAGWSSDVAGSFSFGPGGTNSFTDNNTPSSDNDVISVTALPEQGTLWNGHVIAYIDDNGDALLLSLKEWSGLTSALYESDPDVARNLAKEYYEGNVSGWTIPTNDEARLLRSVWNNSTIDKLSSVATSAGGNAIELQDDNGTNIRYLCEDAHYTFSFVTSSSITAAGKTVKTYHLRLVKHIKFNPSSGA